MLLAAAVATLMALPATMRAVHVALAPFVEAPHLISFEATHLKLAFGALLLALAKALWMPVALLAAAALASVALQGGLVVAPDRIRPKLSHISPLAGLKRQFSSRALVEFAKGVAKLAVIGAIAVLVLSPEVARIAGAARLEMAVLPQLIDVLAVQLLIGTVAAMTAVAALDLLYQRLRHEREQRMTRQEVKDEFKQTEGDPVIKARLRQIRAERARRRMMAEVPDATVVITNPTHYAVALRYDRLVMTAPVVVAKGVDALARRIREVAAENGVPLVENPVLARGLHAAVELDQEIPAEYYRAVAEIVGYVMRLDGAAGGAPGGSGAQGERQ